MIAPKLYQYLTDKLDKSEFESEEYEKFDEFIDELTCVNNHLNAVKTQAEATSKCLYDLQFVTHENLIKKYIKLKEFVRSQGLEVPKDLA